MTNCVNRTTYNPALQPIADKSAQAELFVIHKERKAN